MNRLSRSSEERFFPSEEGGVSSTAQVLFEIKLMQAEAEAKSGRCGEAEEFLYMPAIRVL